MNIRIQGSDRADGIPPVTNLGAHPRTHRWPVWMSAVVVMVLLVACTTDRPANDVKLSCFVSVLPQAFLLERVGGEHVEIHVLVGQGESPATYDPTARQLTRLADADVYFAIGVPFENSILPRLRRGFEGLEVVNTQEGVPMDGGDPHIWLNPRLARTIAWNICVTLVRIDPGHGDIYRRNYEVLSSNLDELDKEVAAELSPYRGRELFVFHPAYGYFAEAYGLSQVAIEAGGMAPGSRHLVTVIERASKQQVRALFVQPQFSRTGAQTIADEIGARVLVLDPLSRDYLDNMREMSRQISLSMQ